MGRGRGGREPPFTLRMKVPEVKDSRGRLSLRRIDLAGVVVFPPVLTGIGACSHIQATWAGSADDALGPRPPPAGPSPPIPRVNDEPARPDKGSQHTNDLVPPDDTQELARSALTGKLCLRRC